MPGNKNSGRRDSLPRGGGRPRTRVIIQMPRWAMMQLEEMAEKRSTNVTVLVQEAIMSFIADQQEASE